MSVGYWAHSHDFLKSHFVYLDLYMCFMCVWMAEFPVCATNLPLGTNKGTYLPTMHVHS